MQQTIKLKSTILGSSLPGLGSFVNQSDMLIERWKLKHNKAHPRPYQITIIRDIYKITQGHVPEMKILISKATQDFNYKMSSVRLILHTHQAKLSELLNSFLADKTPGFYGDSVMASISSSVNLSTIHESIESHPTTIPQ